MERRYMGDSLRDVNVAEAALCVPDPYAELEIPVLVRRVTPVIVERRDELPR